MGPDREPSGEPSLAAGHGAAVCAAGGPAPRRVVPHDEGGLLPAVAGEPGSVGCVRHCVRFPSGLHQRRPMKPLLRILLLAFGAPGAFTRWRRPPPAWPGSTITSRPIFTSITSAASPSCPL